MFAHPLTPYVDVDIVEPWTDPWRFRQERKLWYLVMQFQAGYGVFNHVDDLNAKLDAYAEAAALPINATMMQMIEDRERITKHDVKARIEVFNELAAGFYDGRRWRKEDDAAHAAGTYTTMDYSKLELAHVGMTSADVVDNLSLIQMAVTTKRLLDTRTAHTNAHTHFYLTHALQSIPFRGLKGPVGTQQDMVDLFDDPQAVDFLDAHLADAFGIRGRVLGSVGQVYPRSIDLEVASYLLSAMGGAAPWRTIANGYMAMIAAYSGDQWNEGDVSTSVVRRVALPGIFMCCGAALGRDDL